MSCVVQDSWLHGQYLPPDQPWHLGGFQSNGGTHIVLRHNDVVCDHAQNALGEGCAGAINLIPDFAAVSHATIDHNLLGANIDASYCTCGGEKSTSPFPHADHVVHISNAFQRGTKQRSETTSDRLPPLRSWGSATLRSMRLPASIVQEGNGFVAQCLEVDVAGQGDSPGELELYFDGESPRILQPALI